MSCARPLLPRTIAIVCGAGAKAGDDVLAALMRRGWHGRIVWAFAPVQDRHAAPRVAQALHNLVLTPAEVIIVARGGGSVTDLLAFSDETLCRTVALLPVPVIASIGHHSDRTLLDDVAAASCSTPTHAAEVAVALDCNRARQALANTGRRLRRQANAAVLDRARMLGMLARAPAEHVARQRVRLDHHAHELHAASRRRLTQERDALTRAARALVRQRDGFTAS